MQAHSGQDIHTDCRAFAMLACTWLMCISKESLYNRSELADRWHFPVQGVVKSYIKKHKWFRIEYEDGDRFVL